MKEEIFISTKDLLCYYQTVQLKYAVSHDGKQQVLGEQHNSRASIKNRVMLLTHAGRKPLPLKNGPCTSRVLEILLDVW